MSRSSHAAITTLVRLLSENPSRGLTAADMELNTVDILCRILSSNSSMKLKSDAAELCCVLFENTRIICIVTADRCIEPLISLLVSKFTPTHLSVVHTLDRLIDDEKLAELVSVHGGIIPLVELLHGKNYMLHEATSLALMKMGKDRPSCKGEMVKARVINNILKILQEAPDFLSATLAELLRILANNATIAKGQSAEKLVKPLSVLLIRPELGPDGQHSVLQVFSEYLRA